MALVAYDYNSGSDDEEEDAETTPATVVIIPDKKDKYDKPPSEENTDKTDNDDVNEGKTDEVPELLSHLPKSKPSTITPSQITEDKLEDFIPKYQPTQAKEKRPQKVKITIPSLSEFDDDEDDQPEQKKRKTPSKGSSLLSILPPVRGSPLSTKSFVPNILKNKPPATGKSKTNTLVPHAVRKNAEAAKQATIKKITKISQSGSDIESDDDMELPETFDDDMWQKVCGRRIKPKEVLQPVVPEIPDVKPVNIAPEPVKPYDGLDNAAFKELVGKSKRPVNIKLIDINEDEVLSDKDLWLTKSMTDPDSAPKPVIENPVDPTRKKKHHITYLAEQAKANEQELQGQWAANKYTRNQTRAKYGF